MASIVYTVPYNGTITAAGTDTDLFNGSAADDKPCRLRGILFSQISEVGDAQEEGLRHTIRRLAATVTNGSGGSSVTPAAIDSKDPAAGFTARCNDTTVATTSGTNLILSEIGWNERNSPFDLWFPDDRYAPVFRQAEALIVRQETTLADDMTGCYTFWVEEG